jgi:hypothetical protein
MIATEMIQIAEKQGVRLEFTNYGLAYKIGNTIFMNRNLLKYPKYCEQVFDHELRHSDTYTKKDFGMDLVEGDLWENMKFMLRHPGSMTQLIPFGWKRGVFFIDATLLFIYFLVGLGFWILLKVF